MATVTLGSKAIGNIVKLKFGGVLTDFIVVQQGRPNSALYDTSCDGTWLLMKECFEQKQWHSSNDNKYAGSTIHNYLNNDVLKKFEANIQNAIRQVKIPYHTGYGGSVQSAGNGLTCKLFLLGGYEVGLTTATNQFFPVDGVRLAYFEDGTGTSALNKRIANLKGGSAVNWWLRSPYLINATFAWYVNSNGHYNNLGCSNTYGIRPALILSSNLLVSDDGSVSTNTAPTMPANINLPSTINGGQSFNISWAASSDAEGNLAGYELDRSVNAGTSWANIYKANSTTTSTTDTVPFGTVSVVYRVRAFDSEGLYSEYKISSQVTVVNNVAPTAPASITVPVQVQGGAQLTVTWGAATDSDGNLAGYSLERKHDGDSWAVIYTGTNLSYTDTITKGWATVAYRVCAYDNLNAYGPYAESPERTVDNNTPPSITCDQPSGSDLGSKDSGFIVSYSVDDVDGDTVTVTEAIDGVTKRSFQAVLSQNNTFEITGDTFMRVLNGRHTLTVTANDGTVSTVHTLTFEKKVTRATVTLDKPMDADAEITLAVLSVVGSIPADAEYKVEVTNNGKDAQPVWQDATAEVKSGANIIFANHTAVNGFAFNFRVTVERGASGVGGYITSVQGGFQ